MKLKIILSLCLAIAVIMTSYADETKQTDSKKKEYKLKNQVTNCKIELSLSEIVKRPSDFLNKEVCIHGTFSSFNSLALDYPKAMKPHKDYISLTMLRPETTIPLSELKIVMKTKDAQDHEQMMNLVKGDDVKMKGTVFSDALGEPWVEVKELLITKTPASEAVDKEKEEIEDLTSQ